MNKKDFSFVFSPVCINLVKKIRFGILAFVVLLFAGICSYGQTTVQIGTLTSVSAYVPVYSFNSFNYSQQIYKGTESSLSTYSGQYITAIRFYWTGTGNVTNANSWVIYLGNTTQASFANTTNWVAFGSMTKVYDGTVSFPSAAGWMTILLDAPFQYTGNNIVVAVDENVSGNSSSGCTFKYTATATNLAMAYRNDATNPDPAAPPAASYGPTTSRADIQFDFFNSATPTNVVAVSATSGTASRSYPAVQYAFDAINSGIHKGNVTIDVGSANGQSYTFSSMSEILASGIGSASYSSVLIRPAYTNITITSNLTSSTFRLYNANNITFDGRIGSSGTTKDLTIENSNTSTSSKGVIDFVGASYDTIKYCTLKSSTTSTTGGVGTISMNYSGTAGSSSNVIEYCDITKSGVNWPFVAIACSGTSNTYYCQNNIVRYCTISDFKRAGIWLGNSGADTYNNLWTIDNNTFYQSASFAMLTTAEYANHAIYIGYHASGAMTSTYNDRGSHTITNNTIGGNGSGGNWTSTGNNSSHFAAPIYIAASNPSTGINPANYTYVFGSVIKDFDVQAQYFAGICTDKSKVKVGDTLTGYSNSVFNITLNHASTTTGGTAAGIYMKASANYPNIVSNNTVHDITADAGSTAGFWYNFYGVYAYSGSSVSTGINNRNKVYNISTTKAPSTYGMYMDGNCELNHVSKIKINYATGILFGLYWVCTGSGNAANYRVENNEIILGLDKDGNVTAAAAGNDIIGLYLAAQDVYAYYNSVLIQGSSSSDRSVCLRLNFSGTGATIKNNLLYNNRTGGAGKHMCISTAISLAGNLVSSNNAYIKASTAQNYVGEWGTGTGVSLGYTAGSLKSTLADWMASATNETNSIYALSTDANRDIATMFPSANVEPTSASYNLLPVTPDKWLCHGIDIAPKNDFANPLGIVRPNGGNPGDTTTIGAYEISCNTVLPVELLRFESSCLGNGKVLLLWSTATETNNNYFTIEKSSDGVIFEPVMRVEGAGNSNQLLNYYAKDEEVSPEPTYYRLRQTDFDGSISYSEIISTNCSQNTFSVIISPNPVWEHIDIYLYGYDADVQKITVSVFNSIGQEFAINTVIEENKIIVSFPDKIPSGYYVLRVSDEHSINTCKFLKM